MPITNTATDPKELTVTVVGDYPVTVERLWDAYADPRQLERFWGPVEWPATFTRHDMAPGGQSHYYMTGPDGTRAGGWFRFRQVETGKLIEVDDGFFKDDGTPNDEMPTIRMTFRFEKTKQGARVTTVTRFPNVEAMGLLVDKMQMLEGMKSAMSQIDAVVADLASFAASRLTESQLLSDTMIRVSRVIRGTPQDVWRAHHEPDLMKRWLTGPNDWRMVTCEVPKKVGDPYRQEWERNDGTGRFGFEGELRETEPPHREVTTERMMGMDGPGATNELTLTPIQGGTLLSLVITYPSKEIRDMALGTGMVDGMEASYARLEREVFATR